MPTRIEVTWAQFEIPDRDPAVPPQPGVPLGCRDDGCGCAACHGVHAAIPEPPAVNSGGSVRLASGEVALVAVDVESSGFSFPWGHTRSIASRLTQESDPGNGFDWQVREWSYLVQQESGT